MKERMNRRLFVKLITLGSVSGLIAVFLWKIRSYLKWPVRSLTPTEKKVVSRFVDLLIPQDETPGALAFKVDQDILAKAERRRSYRKTLKQGCRWLNCWAKEAGSDDFLRLSNEQQISVVSQSSEANDKTIERKLFNALRHDAFYFYYARPEVWPSLGYRGPPQPQGYPDYHLKPSRRS